MDSLKLRTDEPFELIFVDNGSTDRTVEYLRSLVGSREILPFDVGTGRTGGLQNCRLIENPDNRGFPAAVNQGLKIAIGEYVVLLNNDTVVTTEWLKRLLDVLESDDRIGLVGPCSNNVSGAQMVPVSYHDMAALDGFAWDWGKRFEGVIEETDRLIGFCLGIKRSVIDQIGLLDERFGIGCFEDDDLCLRALQAGWRAVISRSAFVHHYGNRTFAGSGVDLGAVLAENRIKFLDKWNSSKPPDTSEPKSESLSVKSSLTDRDLTTAHQMDLRFVRSDSGGLLLQRKLRRLSLCMIVRDNESTIGQALESIRPWVDEIIVVDTGSQDRTIEICRQNGAQIFEFPWCDDFSAARNESLKQARGEWIFWMDSDDTITPDCGQALRALADGPHEPNTLGYIMQVHCPGFSDDGELEVTAVDHVKLIRNRPDLRFEGRIHEQLLPAIRRANGDVAWTDIFVRHSGSDHSTIGWQRKLDRDLRILHRELLDAPQHPFVLFNLGMTYADAKQFEAAIGYLHQCLEVSTPDESHLRKAFSLLVSSLSQAERHDEAWQRCQQGLNLYPDDKELLFRAALLLHHFGKLPEAEQTYLKILHESTERYFRSLVQGIDGFKARHNLAIVYEEMERIDLAEEQWRKIAAEIPDYLPAWRALSEILLRQNRIDELTEIGLHLASGTSQLAREAVLIRAKCAAAQGRIGDACAQLRDADRIDDSDLEPLRLLCRILFEFGEPEAAEAALKELCARDPSDPAAHHNLGLICIRRNDRAGAIRALSQSLQLRPNAVETRRQLEFALQA